jgi:CBS-domain-containing membrane protein
MSHPVSTVPTEMIILDAQRYFHERNLHWMPVINPQQHIVGMLSLEDLLQFIIIDAGQMQYVDGKRVVDAMSCKVITSDPVSDIRRGAQVMLEYHLDAVPIVDEQDALIGIVSRGDERSSAYNVVLIDHPNAHSALYWRPASSRVSASQRCYTLPQVRQ